MKQNLKLDAMLVHSAAHGLFVPCAIRLGITATEAFARAEWLKKQGKNYVKKVADRVAKLESISKQKGN